MVKTPFIDWKSLKNPVYKHWRWSIKDACVIHHNNTFFLFFSAFYFDRGRTRSHVVGVKTCDWAQFSKPIFNIDGRDAGWSGMCSPNVSKIGNEFYLTFNSWGKVHPNGKPDMLFYIKSENLKQWTNYKPVAENLLLDFKGIDIALSHYNQKYYVAFTNLRKMFVAVGADIDGFFEFIGDGIAHFKLAGGEESQKHHENF